MALWSPSSSPCPIPSPIPSIRPATLVVLTLGHTVALVGWDTQENLLALKYGLEPSCLMALPKLGMKEECRIVNPLPLSQKGSNTSVCFAPVESCPENSQPWETARV